MLDGVWDVRLLSPLKRYFSLWIVFCDRGMCVQKSDVCVYKRVTHEN
jgi:hypothetical protein